MQVVRSIIKKILLCMPLFFLVACGKVETNTVPMGRYIETNCEVEELWAFNTHVLKYNDGHLVLIYENLDVDEGEEKTIEGYEQQEDLGFKKIDEKWVELLQEVIQEKGAGICSVALDPRNECIYAVCLERKLESTWEKDTLLLKIENNTISEVSFNIEEDFPRQKPKELIILDNGDFILGGGTDKIVEYDLETGNKVKEFGGEEGKVGHILLMDDKLYGARGDLGLIEVYNLSTGMVEEKIACDHLASNSQMVLGEQGIYLVNSEGIWHLAEGGDIWEQLMEGAGTSLGLPSSGVKNVFYQQGQFIVLLENGSYKLEVKTYTYSAATPSKPETELTAYMLEENEIFREMLVGYELQHPEVRIHIVQGMEEESGMTREDAIKALHTQLLAGNEPDILLLDGLDIENYQDKDILLDLNDLSEVKHMLPQITKAMQHNGKLNMVPLRFSVPCFVGNSDILNEMDTIHELLDYQEKHMERTLMYELPEKNRYMEMAKFDTGQWVNEEGEIDREVIGDFLEGIKALGSFYDATRSDFTEEDYGESYIEHLAFVHLVEGKMMIKDIACLDDVSEISGFGKVEDADIEQEVENDTDLKKLKEQGMVKNYSDATQNMILKGIEKEGKVCFEPMVLVGINKNSQKIEQAQAIVNFMLEEPNQTFNMLSGFPTNQTAFEKEETGAVGIGYWNIGEILVMINHNDKHLFPVFDDIIEQLGVPILRQQTLEEMVLEEAEPYFNGEKTLEEVLASLEPRIRLYHEG